MPKNQLDSSIRFDRTPTCDRHRHGHRPMASTAVNIKVKGQLVQKIKWKQKDGWDGHDFLITFLVNDTIALYYYATRWTFSSLLCLLHRSI